MRGWTYVEDGAGRTRVWFRKGRDADQREAQAAAAALDAHIWSEVTQVFRRPLRDNGTGRICRGGSGAIDLAIVDLEPLGWTVPYAGKQGLCDTPSPGFVLLSRGLSGKLLKATVAHELAHTTQLAYPGNYCTDAYWDWFSEATAEWVVDQVYGGGLQTEHESSTLFLSYPDFPLEATVPRGHAYGAYLFFFFLSHQLQNSQLVDRMWQIQHGSGGALAAIQKVLGGTTLGGFSQAWKKFALYNINRTPVDYYERWDDLIEEAKGARPQDEIDLSAPDTRQIPIRVKHLAATYRRFHFDDRVKQIEIDNPLADESGASLQAVVVRREGKRVRHVTADWSKRQRIVICRDRKHDPNAQDVTDLTLVWANSDYQHPSHVLEPDPAPKITTDDQCGDFPERWTGTASGTATESGKWTETFNATGVTLRRYAQGNGTANYELTAAHVAWSYSDGDCSVSESYDVGSIPIGMMILEYDDPDVPDEYDVDLRLAGGDYNPGCDVIVPLNGVGAGDISASRQWTPGAMHLSGQETHPSGWNPDIQVHWQWNLNAG